MYDKALATFKARVTASIMMTALGMIRAKTMRANSPAMVQMADDTAKAVAVLVEDYLKLLQLCKDNNLDIEAAVTPETLTVK